MRGIPAISKIAGAEDICRFTKVAAGRFITHLGKWGAANTTNADDDAYVQQQEKVATATGTDIKTCRSCLCRFCCRVPPGRIEDGGRCPRVGDQGDSRRDAGGVRENEGEPDSTRHPT